MKIIRFVRIDKKLLAAGLFLALLLWLSLSMRVGLGAPVYGDSCAHLNTARQFAHKGVLPKTEHYPLFHIILGAAYFLFGEIGARLLPIVCGLISCVVLFLIVKLLSGRSYLSLIAILLLVTSRDFLRLSSLVFMESMLATFTLLSVYFFLRCLRTSNRRDLVFLGLAVGGALATKLPAFLLLILLPCYFFRARDLKGTILVVLVLVVFLSPFALYQWRYVGTPVPSRIALVLPQGVGVKAPFDRESVVLAETSEHEKERAQFARSFSGAKYFFNLTSLPGEMAVLLLLVFFSLIGASKEGQRDTPILIASLLVMAFLGFRLVSNARYFIGYRILAIPLYALGIGHLFEKVYLLGHSGLRYARVIVASFLVVSLVGAGAGASGRLFQNLNTTIMYQPAKGGYSSLIKAADWLRGNTSKDSIIAGAPPGDIAYYSQRRVVWVGLSARFFELTRTKNEHVARQICKEHSVSYLWIGDYQVKKRQTWIEFFPESGLFSVIGEWRHFQLVYENSDVRIYRVY